MQLKTKSKIYDNSGALLAECIKINRKKIGTIGDIVVVAIKKAVPQKASNSIKIGQVKKALIVNTKTSTKLSKIKDGCKIFWNQNGLILVEKALKGSEWVPIASRVLLNFPLWIGHPQLISLKPILPYDINK